MSSQGNKCLQAPHRKTDPNSYENGSKLHGKNIGTTNVKGKLIMLFREREADNVVQGTLPSLNNIIIVFPPCLNNIIIFFPTSLNNIIIFFPTSLNNIIIFLARSPSNNTMMSFSSVCWAAQPLFPNHFLTQITQERASPSFRR